MTISRSEASGGVLTFEPVAHRYRLGTRDLISVTQALTEAGLVETSWFTPEAARRGTALHAAVQLYLETEAVPTDDSLKPFFDAYLNFHLDAGFVASASEERVCDPLLGYAGTLDLCGCFAHLDHSSHGSDLIDIKTGHVPEWVGYQTAAYARLLPEVRRRWVLNLRADGTYRLQALTNRTDERVFIAALTVAQAKRGWL